MTNRIRGTALYVAVAALSVAAGAAGAWSLRGGHRLDPVTSHGEWVQIKRGQDSIRAYVAYPERKDKAPAVVVIHEIFGLTDWEPTVGDRLAKAGYVAIVPDLLSSKYGISPSSGDSGRKLIAQLEPERITSDLDAVVAYANGLPAVKKGKVGTIGFCWGGGQSFRYATNNPNLTAAVVCYGPPPDSTSLARIKAKVYGVYGEDDARIGATLPDTRTTLKSAHVDFADKTYPGTGHGFLKPGRKGSDGPQVEAAWADILAFYGKTLGK